MRPEDLLDPSKLPDDLQWLVTQYRLHPHDPVFLLIAWHWNRIQACEDTVKSAIAELRAVLDGRSQPLLEAAETVAEIGEALTDVQVAIAEKPGEFAAALEKQLREPIVQAVARVEGLEKTLAPVARNFQVAQRRQLLATLLVGVSLGFLSGAILFLR